MTAYSVPRAVVDAFYQAYAVRDVERIGAFLHDEVQWTVSGPADLLPFCGTWRGKPAVVDLIGRRVPGVIRAVSFVRQVYVVSGDQLAMLNRQTAKRTDDGRVISFRVANFMRFRDDKVIQNFSLLDSFDAVEQVLGHPLAVADGQTVAAGDLVAL